MKLIVLSLTIAVCAARIQDHFEGYLAGQTRYFVFSGDEDNYLHLVDSEEPRDQDFLRNYARNPNNNGYWLYTRDNPLTAQILQFNDVKSVQKSNFQKHKTTIFLAHGWKSSGTASMNTELTAAFLQDDDVNVICLDWGEMAGKSYTTAQAGAVQVGQTLGKFIKWLATLGLDYSRTHLVGFSLGGHLVGHAGRETKGRIKRITALDPAAPLFNNDNRLLDTDAEYVEVIHTSTSWLGYSDPCGHADFYPNGGSGMPGCWIFTCSHSKAWEYMAATVKYNHLHANECQTINDARKNKCSGALVPMGNSDLNKTRIGIFRVNTQSNYPF